MEATGLDGQMVEVSIVDSGASLASVLVGPVSGGVVDLAVVDLTANGNFPNGTFSVCVDATDTYGNLASDTGGSDCSDNVEFDTIAPVIGQVQPAGTFIPGGDDEDDD